MDTFYVTSGSLKKPITKYNGLSHRVISKSTLEEGGKFEQSVFMKGVQVGDLFWIWGQTLSYNPGMPNYCQKTHIWYTKRQKWSSGPLMPSNLRRPWDAVGKPHFSKVERGRPKADPAKCL